MAEEVKESENQEQEKPSGPLDSLFPPEQAVLNECRKLVSDKNVRTENLATVVLQDPIILIELLRVSNAMYFAGSRTAITSPKTAVVRLGSDVVVEILDKLHEREQLKDGDVKKWFEEHRNRGKRVGIVARILAEALAKNLSDDAHAAGCLTTVGEMFAVYQLQAEYVKLAEEHARSGVNYRLNQNFKFDVDTMGLNYLRRQGMPEALVFALDRESRARTPDRAILKPLVMAAAELVDAFDLNRWEKLAPGKRLPPKSALRMLQVNDSQYLKVYERASEYLFSIRMLEEKRKHEGSVDDLSEEFQEDSPEQDALESEIQNLLQGGGTAAKEGEEEVAIHEIGDSLEHLENQFSLNTAKYETKTDARATNEHIVVIEPPKLRTKKGNSFVTSIADMFEEVDSSEELLASLLEMLVDGPFVKSALIVVSHDRGHAIVVAARGPNIGNGQRLELNDPLSPLAQCFSKVQSFATRANEASPFGSKSFALAPVDADHDTPVALYADCGNSGALTFEARRIFRTVVEILNQRLPAIPGGIPVELQN